MAIQEGGGGSTVTRSDITKVAALRGVRPRQPAPVNTNNIAFMQNLLPTSVSEPLGVVDKGRDLTKKPPVTTASTTVTDPYAGMTNQQYNAIRGGSTDTGTVTPTQTGIVPGPLAAPSAPQGGSVDALRDLTGQELEAALAAIESQYGLTREQLMQDQSELGSTYRFLFSNLERQRQAATQGVTGDALQRGILRSGIHQGNVAEVEQSFSEQTAQAEAAKQSRLFQINQALAALGPQQALAQAQASSQIGGSQLALEQQLAALGQLANR